MDDVRTLHTKGLTNTLISKELGLDRRRVSDMLNKMDLKANERIFNEKPTKLQHEVFISCVLGDGAIFKSAKNVNYRMNLAHSFKQKEYFLKKYNIVRDFIGVDYKKVSQYDKRTKKTYHAYKFQSLVNPYFTKLRNEWYENDKKIIPDILHDEMTDRILAYKYFDDGHKTVSGYSIAMCDYDYKSIQVFRNVLKRSYDIRTTTHSGGSVYIPASEREVFKAIIKPYATEDLYYKL